MKIWVGDRLLDDAEARVSVLDHGFTVADGVFETLKVVSGTPFALTRHLARLGHSARGLDLPPPPESIIRDAVAMTVQANVAALGALGRLRITWTAGAGPLGSERGGWAPTLVVATAPLQPWPPTAAVVTVPWTRNERGALAGLKATSYAENVVALARAQAQGASEALLANTQGQLCEGTGSNVFVVSGGRLLTPTLASGALAGITRALVVEWAEVEEADLPLAALGEADEVFLTSSTRDVQPVHVVDGRPLRAPGPVTAAVAELFAVRSAADADP
ncbi:MAG: 4-amino-4-deoxychorismate lyase [Actinomycetota bacterium]|nr:MAG: 4-amino-4-deoxychorismate lyase [Actinomycetota bacterium]